MKRVCVFLCTALLACAGEGEGEPAEVPEAPPNTLTEQEVAEGWRLLFDGVSTAGWRAYNGRRFPRQGWAVRDRTLTVLRGDEADVAIGGDIVTMGVYGSFELRFDFNVSTGGNSGVLYLVQEREGEEIWWNAPEYQVLDDAAYLAMDDMDMRTHLTGENYDLHAATARVVRPPGEWNRGRILIDGTHVEHWLNGEKLVEYELRSPDWEERVAGSKFAEYPNYGRAEAGPLGIQDHGHSVAYRNIKIRRIGETS